MRHPQNIPPPERPMMVFDGQCAFCRARIERWHDAVGEQIEFVPWQQVTGKLPQIDEREFKPTVYKVTGTIDARNMSVWFQSFPNAIDEGRTERCPIVENNRFFDGRPKSSP